MAPSNSLKNQPKFNEDLISNLPGIAIDNILKRLPIKTVAKMSILSKNWRRNWLSLKYLVFDVFFWDELEDNEYTISSCNCIISNILFHHVGPVHLFRLYIPYSEDIHVYNGWVSMLSKIGIKKIDLQQLNTLDYLSMSCTIFNCKDLIKLKLQGFILNRFSNHFSGFSHLQSLELVDCNLKHDVFRNLIANSPQLRRLKVIRLQLSDEVDKNHSDRTVEMLASSSQLQDLHLGGSLFKNFGVGFISMSHTMKFLRRLRLTDVDLSDFGEYCFTLGLVQCSPFIKDFDISIIRKECDVEHVFDYSKICELRHLVKVKITGLTGSNPELKLIEYLFTFASNLEILAFKYYKRDPISELKVTRDVAFLPRASPKARLVCL